MVSSAPSRAKARKAVCVARGAIELNRSQLAPFELDFGRSESGGNFDDGGGGAIFTKRSQIVMQIEMH